MTDTPSPEALRLSRYILYRHRSCDAACERLYRDIALAIDRAVAAERERSAKIAEENHPPYAARRIRSGEQP